MQRTHEASEKFEQIRVCVELGLQCTEFSKDKRPVTKYIIHRLDKASIEDQTTKAGVSTSAVVQVCKLVSQNMVPLSVTCVVFLRKGG